MNSVFGKKKKNSGKWFSDPRSEPWPATRPARWPATPPPFNGGPGRSVGASDPSRTVRHAPNKCTWRHQHHVELFCPAKVMPKPRFWSAFGILGPSWAGPGLRPCLKPENPKMLKQCRYESFDQNYFSGFSTTLKGSA